jgi:SpoVK/Ycf46/Vps4 family AAA+-type ATPase
VNLIFKEKLLIIKNQVKILRFTLQADLKKKTNYILTLWSYELTNEHFDSFSQIVANEFAKSKVNSVWEQKMFTNNSSQWESESLKRNRRRVKTVVLDNNVNLKLLEDIEHFNNSEEWYLERGIPYKKSFLFYGPPGTGKTSIIKALS